LGRFLPTAGARATSLGLGINDASSLVTDASPQLTSRQENFMTLRTVKALWLAAAILATPGAASAQVFGYLGDIGPTFWAELNPAWATCGSGEIQSPVDFRAPYPQRFQRLDVEYESSTGEIFNNGHTIEVETEGQNTLTLDGVAYQLTQFHFHTGSEHRVNGRGYDMELHLVHASASGTNAVVGVFLKRGTSSGALGSVFGSLPDDLNVKHPLDDTFDPETFLPASRTHVRYVGSLTTPPCTEGVQWVVMDEPVTVSDEDIAQFAERIHFNARPVQRSVRLAPQQQ
jgi:carbonic anhydrase